MTGELSILASGVLGEVADEVAGDLGLVCPSGDLGGVAAVTAAAVP